MNTKHYSYIAVCKSCIFFLIILASLHELANSEQPSTGVKIEILKYDDYVERAQRRVISLTEAIVRAKEVRGEAEAYAFLEFMEKEARDATYFYIDKNVLNEKDKSKIDELEKEMKLLNMAAFIALKSVCERVVEANGFGNQRLFVVYSEKLNELKQSVPLQ